MAEAGFWLNMTIASLGTVAFIVAASVFGYKWLAHDEANRSYGCGSGTRGGTCFSGETINMVLALVFAALAVAAIALCVKPVRSWIRFAK